MIRVGTNIINSGVMETSKNEAPERFTMEMNNIKSEISSMYKSFEIKLKS